MRPLILKTFKTITDEDFEEGLFSISVQPFSRWRGFDEPAGLPAEAEVFVYQDPSLTDILGLIGGAKLDRRSTWHEWQTRPSDVEGCVCLHDPRPLRPNMSLQNTKVPVLALVDALASEYIGVQRNTLHSATSPKEYDARFLLRKRSYLQCVLALPDLLRAGVESFSSCHTSAYYSLLLGTHKLPLPGLAAKAYKRDLAKSQGDVLSCRLLDRMVPAPAAREPAAVVEAIDDEIAGDEEGPPPALEPARVPERVAVVEVVGADVAGDCVGEAVAKALVEVPRDIMGQAVKRVRGRDSGGWSYRDRIAISCRNPAHTSCSKSRSLALDLDVFGPTAAVIFLSTWLSFSDTDERIHKKMVPTRAEMRAFISKSAE
jgi:hypothetical protein